MAGIISTDIKSLLTIAVKSRSDGFTDQFNRIYMVKMLLVCSMIMGLSWFKDSIKCIVPEHTEMEGDFVAAACWIQGLYVYREMMSRTSDAGYFGIPKDIGMNGLTPKGTLCRTVDQFGKVMPKEECMPMNKTFYLQYQYMPFYVAALTIVYYLPYIFYTQVNTDLSSLKSTMKEDSDDEEKARKIVKHYFHVKGRQRRSMAIRVLLNILSKVVYILANVIALYGTDSILNGEYTRFGQRFVSWATEPNSRQYSYMGMNHRVRAGDALLPSFGYCEMWESLMDKLHAKANQHKFVCELSQNVLYQYCLIVMWMMIILALMFSIIGLIMLLMHYVLSVCVVRKQGIIPSKLYASLNFREIEYLYLARKKSIPLFDHMVSELKRVRFSDGVQMNGLEETAPLYSPPPIPPPSDMKKPPY